MLSLIDGVENHGSVESRMPEQQDELSSTGDEARAGSTDGDVYREYGSGHSNEASENPSGIHEGRESDQGGSVSGSSSSERLSMACLGKSRDGNTSDRETVRSSG
jgi:hypothetical protein